jgi:transcriptional regulator with XRE-family HTH domain
MGMSELQKRFGKMLKGIRIERKQTQAGLSMQCDLSKDMITKIERGQTGVSFDTIETLARVLDVEPASLFSSDVRLRQSRSPTLRRIQECLSPLNETDLKWVDGLLAAALKPRRQESPLDKSRVKKRTLKRSSK